MWHPTGISESSDSQLQTAACPLLGHKGLCYRWTHKQSLDVLLEWIAVVCITQLIEAERFKRRAEFFIPVVCFNCMALHLLSQTMREKTEKLWGEVEELSGRCFWDRADKCQHYRTSHFSACLSPFLTALRRWPTHYP